MSDSEGPTVAVLLTFRSESAAAPGDFLGRIGAAALGWVAEGLVPPTAPLADALAEMLRDLLVLAEHLGIPAETVLAGALLGPIES